MAFTLSATTLTPSLEPGEDPRMAQYAYRLMAPEITLVAVGDISPPVSRSSRRSSEFERQPQF